MTEEAPNVISRIRRLADPTSTPTTSGLVSILELLIEAEPEVVAILPALFPGNATIIKAVSILPTLLPWLQKIEIALAG